MGGMGLIGRPHTRHKTHTPHLLSHRTAPPSTKSMEAAHFFDSRFPLNSWHLSPMRNIPSISFDLWTRVPEPLSPSEAWVAVGLNVR